jgi:RarD protein
MSNIKNQKFAIPVVLLAGIIWSFGPYVVRHMDEPNVVAWQYLFTRGLVIFFLINIYLYFEEGKKFYKNYFNIGISGIVGGIGLGTAMMSFIWSITNTSAAITLLCLASMPFITALLGFLFLKEKISLSVWIAILFATVGVGVMSFESVSIGSITGLIFGLASALGFSIFSVSLRWRKETPKFTTVAFAGLFCCLVSLIVIVSNELDFLSSSKNSSLFALHGALVSLGMILYSIGSKYLPAAELTLLSLLEIIGGIFWVWIPILGINEIPSSNTIVGGFLIFVAIIYYSLIIKQNRRFIGLN